MVRAVQHELQLARRMSRLGTETAFEVLNKARALERQGNNIIHLEIGEPDFDTPRNVVDAGVDALRKGWTHYGPAAGLPELRQTMVNYVGGRAVPIRLREERDFSLDLDELAALVNDRTRLIILNSPQNPTGGVLDRKEIEQIARAIGDRNILVLSDEIYSRLVFDGGEHFSIMSVPGMQERTILLDGFSKTYAMTGWRM